MNDETRKALDKIFGHKGDNIRPSGASMFYGKDGIRSANYVGKFEVYGWTLNHLRKLYDDAIAADDAAKKDKELNAENAKIIKDSADRVAAAEAAFEAAKAEAAATSKKMQDKSGDE